MFQSATEPTEWILYKTLEAKFQYAGPLIVPVLHLSELLATALQLRKKPLCDIHGLELSAMLL